MEIQVDLHKPDSIKFPTESKSAGAASGIPTTSPDLVRQGRFSQKARSPLRRGLIFDLDEARRPRDSAPTEEEIADTELAEAADLAFRALDVMSAIERGEI